MMKKMIDDTYKREEKMSERKNEKKQILFEKHTFHKVKPFLVS